MDRRHSLQKQRGDLRPGIHALMPAIILSVIVGLGEEHSASLKKSGDF
jgi:hypothetical protein